MDILPKNPSPPITPSKTSSKNSYNNATIKKPPQPPQPPQPISKSSQLQNNIFYNENITYTNHELLKNLLKDENQDLNKFISEYEIYVVDENIESKEPMEIMETFILLIIHYKPYEFELIKNILFLNHFHKYYEKNYQDYLILILNYFKYNLIFLLINNQNYLDIFFTNNKNKIFKTIKFIYSSDTNFLFNNLIEYISQKNKSYTDHENYFANVNKKLSHVEYYNNLKTDLKQTICGIKSQNRFIKHDDIISIFLIHTVYNLDKETNICNESSFLKDIIKNYNKKIQKVFEYEYGIISNNNYNSLFDTLNRTKKTKKPTFSNKNYFIDTNNINYFDIYPNRGTPTIFNLYYKTDIISSILENICSLDEIKDKKKILYIFFYEIVINNICFNFLREQDIKKNLTDDEILFFYLNINVFFNWLLFNNNNDKDIKKCKNRLNEIIGIKQNNHTSKTKNKKFQSKSLINNIQNHINKPDKPDKPYKTLGGKPQRIQHRNKTHKRKAGKKRKNIKTKKQYNKTK